MSSDLPPDAVGFRIAAVVPCSSRYPCPDYWHKDSSPHKCSTCLGDGTRVVVTDVEVEQITEPPFTDDGLWQEVPRG